NLYLSGDWVITHHGSWSQEKAYVTGLEAANLVIEQLGGNPATIIPVEPDEPHIQSGRIINQNFRKIVNDFVPPFWLP
ncbi:MAG: amine oxidase, partial [Crocosphaera sp.]